jgi:hypothetical protein
LGAGGVTEDGGGGFATEFTAGEERGIGLDDRGGEQAERVEGTGDGGGAEDFHARLFGVGERGQQLAGLGGVEQFDHNRDGEIQLAGDGGDGTRVVEEERHQLGEELAIVCECRI